MTPPPLPFPESRRRNHRAVRVTLLVAVLLLPVIGGSVWLVSFRVRNAKAVKRLETKAKSRGEPLTLAELAAIYPPIPDDENAAVLFLELWKKEDPAFWKAFFAGERKLPTRSSPKVNPALPFLSAKAPKLRRTGPVAPESLNAAEDYLKQRAAHSQAVQEALRRPGCRFPIKITDGFEALMPHLGAIKSEAQELRVQALAATERGDIAGAITAIANTARLGNLLAHEPLLISQLVRISCLTIALQDAERLLSRRELTLDELGRLEKMLEECQMTGSLRSAYVSDRVHALSVFEFSLEQVSKLGSGDDSGEGDSDEASYQTGISVMSSVGLVDADRRLILETFETALENADRDDPQALLRRTEVFEEAADAARKFPPKMFSAMLLPSMAKAGLKFANFEARRRAALTAIAIEKFRLAHKGEAPERLAQLVPQYFAAVPLDPFNGQPLRFRKLERGFVVYSVGSDRHDNGGKERPEKGRVGELDETFFVER